MPRRIGTFKPKGTRGGKRVGAGRKRMRVGKMSRAMIFPKGIYSLPHRFSRWGAPSLHYIDLDNTNSFNATAMTFDLAQVISPTEFGNLFDQYRIDRVEVHLRWNGYSVLSDLSVAGANNITSLTGLAPVLYYKRDYDDANVPADLNVLNEAAKTRRFTMKPDKDYVINITPAVLTEIYRTSVSTSYAPKFKQVLDMGAQNIPHYGLKLGTLKQQVPLGRINIHLKYYFTCFNTR